MKNEIVVQINSVIKKAETIRIKKEDCDINNKSAIDDYVARHLQKEHGKGNVRRYHVTKLY